MPGNDAVKSGIRDVDQHFWRLSVTFVIHTTILPLLCKCKYEISAACTCFVEVAEDGKQLPAARGGVGGRYEFVIQESS